MRIVWKTLGGLLACVGVLAVSGYLYLLLAYPRVDAAPAVRAEATPERLARGKYLADHVAVCTDCHSQRDWTKYAGPVKPDTYAAGGEVWDETVGFPGRLVSKNLTPAALGSWSDGEVLRAITEGVSKDGTPLFSLMPYALYGKHLSREDALAIVAYLRTLTPRTTEIAPRRLDFPLPLVVRTLPARATLPAAAPPATDVVAYGAYLTNVAACTECHTPVDSRHTALPGMQLAGGQEFPLPNGLVARSANLTSDRGTGIGAWTEDEFVAKFAAYRDGSPLVPVKAGDFNTPMPWQSYAGMTDADLKAIFAYLKTVPAVAHRVEKVGRRDGAADE